MVGGALTPIGMGGGGGGWGGAVYISSCHQTNICNSLTNLYTLSLTFTEEKGEIPS